MEISNKTKRKKYIEADPQWLSDEELIVLYNKQAEKMGMKTLTETKAKVLMEELDAEDDIDG